jgi:hypothetical protein
MSQGYKGVAANGFMKSGSSFIGLSGGLNTSTDPIVLQPPQVTMALNVWYITEGQIRAIPSFIQGQWTSTPFTSTYGVFNRDVQAPSTTGDVMALAEIPENGFSSSFLFGGSGSTPAQLNTNMPVLPLTMRSRAFYTPDTAQTVAAIQPMIAKASNGDWGVALINNAIGLCAVYQDFSGDFSQEKFATTQLPTFSTVFDIVELGGTPGSFILANNEGGEFIVIL